jgi:hypothetical protein
LEIIISLLSPSVKYPLYILQRTSMYSCYPTVRLALFVSHFFKREELNIHLVQ